jgi:hypothetical protein
MNWFLRSVFSCAAVGATFATWSAATRADERTAEPRLARTKIVEDALRREASEAVEDRCDLLRPALAQGVAYPPAYWQSGFVFDTRLKEWMTPAEVAAESSHDPRLKAYAKFRGEHGDTIEGHLEVARWCIAKKLDDEAHAHLTRVLELDPNQSVARRLLGYRLERGSWINQQEQAEAQAKANKAAKDLAKWKPLLEKLRSAMRSGSKSQRAQRRSKLEAIRDPAAVGAIDAVFCARGGDDMQLGISLLENLQSAESAAILARYAVFAPWDSAGKRAAQALRSQRTQDYVPLLLAGMQSQVYSRAEVYQDVGSGQTYYRQIFFRDGEEREVAVVDSNPRPRTRGLQPASPQNLAAIQQARLAASSQRGINAQQGSGPATSSMSGLGTDVPQAQSPLPASTAGTSAVATTLDDPGLRTIMRAVGREQGSTAPNSTASILNRRLSAALAEATGESKLSTSADWWRWWYNENDCLPPIRAYRVSYTPNFPKNMTPAPEEMSEQEYQSLQQGPQPPPQPYSWRPCECFAAGTPVWTESGPVAVEKIRMGDRVFACDPETGCLALKVVLRPTVRPPTQLLKIRLDSEEIRSTGGHCYWVSGKGWMMARELQVGMNVHTLRGTATVAAIEKDKTEAAYNLVVEGFHTYFAGKGKYLTHDNTIRRPTDRVVPGLAASR